MIRPKPGGVLPVALLLLAAIAVSCSELPFVGTAAPEQWSHDRIEELPAPGDLGGLTLADALAQRRSTREFARTELTDEQAAALLWAAQGLTAPWGGRTAPSAGALYALEVYLVTSAGIQHYVPEGHRIEVQENPDARVDVARAVGQGSAEEAPALLVITGMPGRLTPKYFLRAERYTLLEAGHAAQNVLLAATALGLGGVPIGAFDAADTAAALRLPRGEDPIYVIPIGVPAAQSR